MTALAAMFALAGISWVFRVMFVVVVPASRLPDRVREALGHLAPAALAALVTVEVAATLPGSGTVTQLAILGCVVLVAVVARLTRSMALSMGVALAVVLVLDVGVRSWAG